MFAGLNLTRPSGDDVMARHVALMFADAGSVVGHINAGRVRTLGVSSTARVPALPDVLTIAESGVPGFDAVGWTMICAPSATPKPVIDRLHAELKAVAATPEVRDVIVRIGTIPVDSPPPAELFQSMTATKMNGIAYRGAPPALNDVMAGHVALMFADAGSVVGHINAGRVRALGVSSSARVPALPDVPTIAESGVPGFDAVGWTMICAPSATPKPVIDRLHAELKAVAAMPQIRDVIVRIGTIPVDSPPPAELQKFLASEIDRWGGLIARAGLARTE